MADANYALRTCTGCSQSFPATTEFFSPRKAGKLKLTSRCKQCNAQDRRRERAESPEHRAKHVAAVIAYQKRRATVDPKFRDRLKELAKVRKARFRADPIKRERELAADREWRKANWDRVKQYKHKSGLWAVVHQAARHAAKSRATPAWTETAAIGKLYERARELTRTTGIEHNVDHIVPIRGRYVCGLHVLANLRVVTAFENKTKYNKLIDELASA